MKKEKYNVVFCVESKGRRNFISYNLGKTWVKEKVKVMKNLELDEILSFAKICKLHLQEEDPNVEVKIMSEVDFYLLMDVMNKFMQYKFFDCEIGVTDMLKYWQSEDLADMRQREVEKYLGHKIYTLLFTPKNNKDEKTKPYFLTMNNSLSKDISVGKYEGEVIYNDKNIKFGHKQEMNNLKSFYLNKYRNMSIKVVKTRDEWDGFAVERIF